MMSHPSAIMSLKESFINREGGRGVGEAKEHNGRFKEAFVGDEGGLPLMSVFDADVVVTPSDVKLSEDFGVSEFID